MIRKHLQGYRWEGVEVHPYKEEGTHFKSITRQTLFKGDGEMPVECRYFEVLAGGHSTLERHEHQHLVMVIRGKGHVLVGDQVSEIAEHDLVHIPAMTWHQFRATSEQPLGFWCVVRTDRDKPQRPTSKEELQAEEAIAEFVRL